MEKSDLKTGMMVKYRNGEYRIVLLNTKQGDILKSSINSKFAELVNTREDLTNIESNMRDIIEIYEPTNNSNYLSEIQTK